MRKTIRNRLAAGALAIAALGVTGVVADATVSPAVSEASAASSTQYCNWPNRARIGWTGQATVVAYSPGGALLGSRTMSWAGYWYTPWEDVRFVISGPYGSYSTACYY